MSTTPELPNWVREARCKGYRGAYEYCPEETRLYGTESLYGDWGGRVLILGQDFACSRIIEERLAAGDERPYRHDPMLMTNVRLSRFADPLRLSIYPDQCGMVYGSALGFLLRDDGRMRGSLPNKRNAMHLGARVVEWTINNMPNLDTILCLGGVAWETVSLAVRTPKDRSALLESGAPASARGLRIFAAHHPVASVLKTKAQIPWQNAARSLAA